MRQTGEVLGGKGERLEEDRVCEADWRLGGKWWCVK